MAAQPPKRVQGLKRLRTWLQSVGIRVRTATLERLSGEMRLFGPSDEIEFTAEHCKSLVGALTGVAYDTWVPRWEASGKTEMLWSESMRNAAPSASSFSGIYALMVTVDGDEHVLRANTGFAYVAFTRADFWGWPLEARKAASTCVRMRTSQLAKDSDFEPARGAADGIVCVRLMRGGIMRTVRVDGEEFGVQGKTPLLAPRGWDGWPYWRERLARELPDAAWSLYKNRWELDRITREPMPMVEPG